MKVLRLRLVPRSCRTRVGLAGVSRPLPRRPSRRVTGLVPRAFQDQEVEDPVVEAKPQVLDFFQGRTFKGEDVVGSVSSKAEEVLGLAKVRCGARVCVCCVFVLKKGGGGEGGRGRGGGCERSGGWRPVPVLVAGSLSFRQACMSHGWCRRRAARR